MAWTKNRNDFITSALQMAKILSVGNVATTPWINIGADKFQAIVEDLNNQGYDVLETEWITQTLTASSEVTGTDNEIYTCIRSHTSSTYDEPITGDNWESYWKKGGSTGGAWNNSTSYKAIGDFDADISCLEIKDAFLRDESGNDYPLLTPMSRREFMSIDDKYATGLPDYIFVDYQTSNFIPHIYLYEQPDKTSYILNYLSVKKMDSIDTSTSIPDINKRYYNYIIYRLAELLADVGGNLNISEKQLLSLEAKELLKEAKDFMFFSEQNPKVSYGSYLNK